VGANGVYKGVSPGAIVWAGVPCKPLKINKIGLDRHANENENITLVLQAQKFLFSKGL
jgi:acyl-[acyl carrier protein]--UDP-N-acetylglucosamine O-acyltransferase